MSSKELHSSKDSMKMSPTPSSNSERDGSDDARKINIGKVMGESDDENMSGFESDSEDEAHQHDNSELTLHLSDDWDWKFPILHFSITNKLQQNGFTFFPSSIVKFNEWKSPRSRICKPNDAVHNSQNRWSRRQEDFHEYSRAMATAKCFGCVFRAPSDCSDSSSRQKAQQKWNPESSNQIHSTANECPRVAEATRGKLGEHHHKWRC